MGKLNDDKWHGKMAMAKWIKMATFKLCMVGFVMYGNKSFKGGFFMDFVMVLVCFFCYVPFFCNFSVDDLRILSEFCQVSELMCFGS